MHTGDIANPGLPGVDSLANDGLDLAFLHLYFLTDKPYLKKNGLAAIEHVVGAKWIVPMHCALEELADTDTYQQLRIRYPQSMLFHERLVPEVLP